MKPLPLLIAVAPVVLLSSCVSKFTPAQREALSTVAIAPTQVKPNAYSEPYGGDRGVADQAGMVGVTSQTGAIGGALGAIIGESIAATQDNMFRNQKKGLFGAVQTNTPQVGVVLNAKLVGGLKNDPFFKSRLRPASPNSITSTVTSYQLIRVGKENDELLFAPRIVTEMSLNDGSGKALAKGIYTGIGDQKPIEFYASSAAKSKESYEKAAKLAADQFTAVLARKLGD